MKYQLIVLTSLLLFSIPSMAQRAGNMNYQNITHNTTRPVQLQVDATNNINITARGLSNIKADVLVAIFSITQKSTTAQKATELLNQRISSVKTKLSNKAELYVDMVSFVPLYEFSIEKKIFSKTYNEVPYGYELKKNLHIKFTEPDLIHSLISICAEAEIHDLVRVDDISTQLTTHKNELKAKVKAALLEKVAFQEQILGISFQGLEKKLADGFNVYYPKDMYKSYQAYSSSSISSKSATVRKANKSKTLYYQAIENKDFDVVLQPVVFSPVIQLEYEVTLQIIREKEKVIPKKKIILLTPNGELHPLETE